MKFRSDFSRKWKKCRPPWWAMKKILPQNQMNKYIISFKEKKTPLVKKLLGG